MSITVPVRDFSTANRGIVPSEKNVNVPVPSPPPSKTVIANKNCNSLTLENRQSRTLLVSNYSFLSRFIDNKNDIVASSTNSASDTVASNMTSSSDNIDSSSCMISLMPKSAVVTSLSRSPVLLSSFSTFSSSYPSGR